MLRANRLLNGFRSSFGRLAVPSKRFNSSQTETPAANYAYRAPVEAEAPPPTVGSAIILGLAISSFIYGSYNTYLLFFDYPEPVEMMWNVLKDHPQTTELFGENVKKWRIWHGFVDNDIASVKLYLTGSEGTGIARAELARTSKFGWDIIALNAWRTDSTDKVLETGYILNGKNLTAQATGANASAPLTDDVLAALTGHSINSDSSCPQGFGGSAPAPAAGANACPAGHGAAPAAPAANACPAGHGTAPEYAGQTCPKGHGTAPAAGANACPAGHGTAPAATCPKGHGTAPAGMTTCPKGHGEAPATCPKGHGAAPAGMTSCPKGHGAAPAAAPAAPAAPVNADAAVAALAAAAALSK